MTFGSEGYASSAIDTPPRQNYTAWEGNAPTSMTTSRRLNLTILAILAFGLLRIPSASAQVVVGNARALVSAAQPTKVVDSTPAFRVMVVGLQPNVSQVERQTTALTYTVYLDAMDAKRTDGSTRHDAAGHVHRLPRGEIMGRFQVTTPTMVHVVRVQVNPSSEIDAPVSAGAKSTAPKGKGKHKNGKGKHKASSAGGAALESTVKKDDADAKVTNLGVKTAMAASGTARHSFVWIVISGRGKLSMDGKTQTVGSGSIIVVHAGHIGRVLLTKTGGARLRVTQIVNKTR